MLDACRSTRGTNERRSNTGDADATPRKPSRIRADRIILRERYEM